MSIPSGTWVCLPSGHVGIVIPSPVPMAGQVLVKLRSGRRRWVKVSLCSPIAPEPIAPC